MTLQERFERHFDRTPDTASAAFVAANATVLGDVRLGRDSSVFYGAVLRGDIQSITVGEGSNIQDGAIVHLSDEFGATIGAYTTVGHAAMIHGCTIGDECLIGMRAIILDGAQIGDQCLIGAGALIPPGKQIPAGSKVLGTPPNLKILPLTAEERAGLRYWAEKYVQVARRHAAQ